MVIFVVFVSILASMFVPFAPFVCVFTTECVPLGEKITHSAYILSLYKNLIVSFLFYHPGF